MRKNWLLLGIGLLVSVLAVASVGCSNDDADGGDATRLTATLAEVEGSGVTGTATLTEADDGATQAVVEMVGLDGTHANHLHQGTCDAQAEVHVTLGELQAGNESKTTTFFEEPDFAHFEAGHYVAVHEAGGAPGPVISCGDLE